jgi:hypothetical protein
VVHHPHDSGSGQVILHNTTDIPDKLVAISVAYSIQVGVEISSITLTNKRERYVHGNWGRYFPLSREITLNVPRQLFVFCSAQPYSGRMITCKSRAEWLVRVMAHELRHAFQFQIQKINIGLTLENRRWRELDCESYEEQQVMRWRSQFGDLAEVAASNR